MNSEINLHSNILTQKTVPKKIILSKLSVKNERKILKAFLLGHLHHLFYELLNKKLQPNYNNYSMECYDMDNRVIQFLIQSIIETGEYTLEGIAFHTRIPFDVIYDAACGIPNQFSITPWARIVALYLQVKPDVAQLSIDRLLEIKDKNPTAFSSLLSEN